MMKKLLLIALASSLLASGANAEWKYVEKVDEMTGKTKAIILSEQRNRTGAVAYVTADCKAPEKIVFAALFTDEQGEPIKLSNLKFHEEMGRWRVQVGRYRIDEQNAGGCHRIRNATIREAVWWCACLGCDQRHSLDTASRSIQEHQAG
ncbi:NCAIR mutase (PurE)-related protein [Bradyrhizobium sp. LB14.3]|uniref:hypothetical protein n=1 Tax=Bradyrhizobium sp. LB14.3 TaxID=3156328 RepID=UPI0033951D4A